MAPSSLLDPMTWSLQPGSGGLPALRVAGSFALCGCALLGLCWLLAIGQDVLRGGRTFWPLLACAGLLWCAWRPFKQAWVQWHHVPSPVLLTWSGTLRSNPPAGGWRLGGPEGHPVEVRRLLDLQGWILCQIRSVGEGALSPQVQWCWVTAQRCPDLHLFRTLIMLPARLTTAAMGDCNRGVSAMASSGLRHHPTGITLRGDSDTFMPTQPMQYGPVTAGRSARDHS
jgi:hypothetical protein